MAHGSSPQTWRAAIPRPWRPTRSSTAVSAPDGRSAAADIARLAGADAETKPFWPLIQGKLLSGDDPLYVSARVVGAQGFQSEIHEKPPWPEDEKVVAAELGPYLATLDSQPQ
jgi:hypothetical protein